MSNFKVSDIFDNIFDNSNNKKKQNINYKGNLISNSINSFNNTRMKVFEKINNISSNRKIVFIILITAILYLVISLIYKYFFGDYYNSKLKSYYKKKTNAMEISKDTINGITNGVIRKLPQQNTHDFSYCIWIYINQSNEENNWWDLNWNKWKHIFHRGTMVDNNPKYQFPGLWITPNNNISCVFESIKGLKYGESLMIENIPLNKWFHICVTHSSNIATIYVNSKLVQSITLWKNLSNNNSSLYVCQDVNGISGFNGYIKNLHYIPDISLTHNEIINIYKSEYKEL